MPRLASSTENKEANPTPSRRIAGYRGIWFTLGQFYGPGEDGKAYGPRSSKPLFPYGDKYSGGLGTYTAKHSPLVIHVPKVDRTYFVYGGTTQATERHLLCMISYFDHATGKVPRPVVVYDKMGVDDPHDNPSLAIDEEGYIWVFVSGRSKARPGIKLRSHEPYEIDRFDQVQIAEFTYPQPHPISGFDAKSDSEAHSESSDDSNRNSGANETSEMHWNGRMLHLFTKYSGVRELYFETSVNGKWTETQKLAGIRGKGEQHAGHYQTSAPCVIQTAVGPVTKVGTFFNRHPNGDVDKRTDLYYLETIDGGKSWRSIDGTKTDLPLTEIDCPARVADWSSQKKNVYLKNMAFARDANPVLLFVTSGGAQPGPPNAPRILHTVHWNGTQWKTSMVRPVDHNYDMGSLCIQDDQWLVFAPTDAGPQPHHCGGEIVRFSSVDRGANWQRTDAVTADSARNHNYVRHGLNARDPFFMFWADGDPTKQSKSCLHFCDSTGQNVYQLPYDMDGDWEKPSALSETLDE